MERETERKIISSLDRLTDNNLYLTLSFINGLLESQAISQRKFKKFLRVSVQK